MLKEEDSTEGESTKLIMKSVNKKIEQQSDILESDSDSLLAAVSPLLPRTYRKGRGKY